MAAPTISSSLNTSPTSPHGYPSMYDVRVRREFPVRSSSLGSNAFTVHENHRKLRKHRPPHLAPAGPPEMPLPPTPPSKVETEGHVPLKPSKLSEVLAAEQSAVENNPREPPPKTFPISHAEHHPPPPTLSFPPVSVSSPGDLEGRWKSRARAGTVVQREPQGFFESRFGSPEAIRFEHSQRPITPIRPLPAIPTPKTSQSSAFRSTETSRHARPIPFSSTNPGGNSLATSPSSTNPGGVSFATSLPSITQIPIREEHSPQHSPQHSQHSPQHNDEGHQRTLPRIPSRPVPLRISDHLEEDASVSSDHPPPPPPYQRHEPNSPLNVLKRNGYAGTSPHIIMFSAQALQSSNLFDLTSPLPAPPSALDQGDFFAPGISGFPYTPPEVWSPFDRTLKEEGPVLTRTESGHPRKDRSLVANAHPRARTETSGSRTTSNTRSPVAAPPLSQGEPLSAPYFGRTNALALVTDTRRIVRTRCSSMSRLDDLRKQDAFLNEFPFYR